MMNINGNAQYIRNPGKAGKPFIQAEFPCRKRVHIQYMFMKIKVNSRPGGSRI